MCGREGTLDNGERVPRIDGAVDEADAITTKVLSAVHRIRFVDTGQVLDCDLVRECMERQERNIDDKGRRECTMKPKTSRQMSV